MKYLISIMVLILLLGCTKHPLKSAVDLTGSIWEETDKYGNHTVYEFFENGFLLHKKDSWNHKNKGKWSQQGESISIEINKGYANYSGTVRGDDISGNASNVKGLKWKWRFTRVN